MMWKNTTLKGLNPFRVLELRILSSSGLPGGYSNSSPLGLFK
jgi:hypothetical protein